MISAALGVGTLVGSAASIASMVLNSPLWPTAPEIQQSGHDPGSPFSLPFTATNRSALFDISGATFACKFKRLVAGGNVFTDAKIRQGAPIDIPATQFRTFSCGILVAPFSVTEGTLQIQTNYHWKLRWARIDLPSWEDGKSRILVWTKTSDGGRWVDTGVE
jgi:hypothetical protein